MNKHPSQSINGIGGVVFDVGKVVGINFGIVDRFQVSEKVESCTMIGLQLKSNTGARSSIS